MSVLPEDNRIADLYLPGLQPGSLARPWQLADYLRRAQRQLKQEWQQIEAGHYARTVRLDTHYKQTQQSLQQNYDQQLLELESRYRREREAADREKTSKEAAAVRERDASLAEAEQQRQKSQQLAEQDWENRRLRLQEMAAEGQARIDSSDRAWQAQWNAHNEQIERLVQETRRLVTRWKVPPQAVDITDTQVQLDKPTSWATIEEYLDQAGRKVHQLHTRPSARFLAEGWTVLVGLAFALLAIYPSGSYFGWDNPWWLLTLAIVGVVSWWASTLAGRRLAFRMALSRLPELRADLGRARQGLLLLRDEHGQALQHQRDALSRWLADELQRCQEAYHSIVNEIERRYATRCAEVHRQFEARQHEATVQWELTHQRLRQTYPPQMELLRSERQEKLAKLEEQYRVESEESNHRRNEALAELRRQWQQIRQFIAARTDEAVAAVVPGQVEWQQMAADGWLPPAEPASMVPFGKISARWVFEQDLPFLDSADIDAEFSLPAALTIPDCPSLIVEYSDSGRKEALELLHVVMLRWMASVPPGKVRFTLIDPWGLGQSFAAFMHLADYDEKLIGYRIWTDADHIRQRLTDLTEHVEMVIQKYLRNEYRSIHEYNAQAGQMAEPVHVVVVAGFPEGFGEESARRLASLASSGPCCGVFLLVAVDMRMRLPREFFLDELHAHAAVLYWDGNRFAWKHPQLRSWKLEIDYPPPPDLLKRIIHRWGMLSVGANRVEVPFRAVAPEETRWWTGDSRQGVEVPVGRAGAARLQYVRLGKGTSQHMIVAGKTGSGKSTFFHVLICNTALHYSPEEVVFYLIDFKKGVEFKAYSEYQLPHAEVIAIESEREFGLSVLQRLDEEIQRRGEIFRDAGVQDIASYRQMFPHEVMPRILLIVDEFQEFFVKEDTIARDAALLLDRLVRQGRAFGVHVILGSQTLSGAYSLARSTLSQMAVRVALQCSETDAHLILSEDNTAARLLSRPGEAIYNDTNGFVEGNHPFQVVWLADYERIELLQRLKEHCRQRRVVRHAPIVFEGNRPALLEENEEILAVVQQRHTVEPATAWLGAAIAIRPPASICFRPQPAMNLLIVGQDRSLLLGILTASVIGLTATLRASSHALRLDLLCGELAERRVWQEGLPIIPELRLVDAPGTGEILDQWCEELARRQEGKSAEEYWFMVIDSLSRFPILRPEETDFGFASFTATANQESHSRRWQRLLRDGPSYRMHFIVACDGYHTFSRWCERSWLREFHYRVLLQMNPTDSSHFIDSPAAHQLGPYRALLYRDDRADVERFRPYGLPPPWNVLVVG